MFSTYNNTFGFPIELVRWKVLMDVDVQSYDAVRATTWSSCGTLR